MTDATKILLENLLRRENGADVMIGCASFPGTDPSAHALALSFLHHNSLAPEDWRVAFLLSQLSECVVG